MVDDDETFRIIIRESLSKSNYSLDEAGGANEARNKLAVELPDLILLDIMMPDLDGVAFLREIRSNPKHKNIPIMVVSALGNPQVVGDALKFGATEYVVKPVDMMLLKGKVDKILSKKK